jgi:uncharacterized protein (TIGR01777 family)
MASEGLNVLLTGAGGLIGSAVRTRAAERGWRIVPLRREQAGGRVGAFWGEAAGRIELNQIGPIDAVIHLAGENIAQRWSAATRRRIRDSRVEGTLLLAEALRRTSTIPRVVLGASAIGYYGPHGEEWVDESAPSGSGFLAQVCREWEAAETQLRIGPDTRLVHLRTGLVLSPDGGALRRMLPIFRLGLGGRVGTGGHYWSWITLHDLVRAMEHILVDSRLHGPVNAVAPNPVTNAEFTRLLGRALRRPAILPVPGLVLRAIFGQMAQEALLSGARVRPEKLLKHGFQFRDATLPNALAHFFQ